MEQDWSDDEVDAMLAVPIHLVAAEPFCIVRFRGMYVRLQRCERSTFYVRSRLNSCN